MARLFNMEVFNMTIGNGGPYYTGQEFYSLLGSADFLVAQVDYDAITTTTTTIDVALEITNAPGEQTWMETDYELSVPLSSLSGVPHQEGLAAPDKGKVLGAYVRYRVTSDQPAATVRITVCGRSL